MRLAILLPLTVCFLAAETEKLSPEERLELVRGLTAEYATLKIAVPRSKKPLEFQSTGTWDQEKWAAADRETGPAGRPGDLVQITKVTVEKDRILLELNGGLKSGVKWYDRIEVGTGTRRQPVSRSGNPTLGTNLALVFPKHVPPLELAEFKALLAPLMDFEKRTATEQYIDTLPPEIQAAVKENRAVEGMDREQVMMAIGRPRDKLRETRDGEEYEDWIYGLPPGKITFVTFKGRTVVQVKETYAGLGGSVAPPLPVQ